MRHRTNIQHSPRIQNVYKLLLTGWYTQLEIQELCKPITAVTATISDIDDNGIDVEHRTRAIPGSRGVREYHILRKNKIKIIKQKH